jgi:hypothetical protein
MQDSGLEARVTGQPAICGLHWGIAARAAAASAFHHMRNSENDVDVDVIVERKRGSVEWYNCFSAQAVFVLSGTRSSIS